MDKRLEKVVMAVKAKRIGLRQAASPKQTKPSFSFVFMGDSWVIGGNLTGEAIFNPILSQSNKLNPAFIIHGGDGTFSGTAPEYRCMKFKVNKYIPGKSFIFVPGNHDAVITGTNPNKKYDFTNYKTTFPRRFTPDLDFTVSFFQDRVRVIAMNTVRGFDSQGRSLYGLNNRQLRYLEKQLQTSRLNIVTMHAPAGEWSPRFQAQRTRFLQILNRKKVPLVLQSHVHEYKKVVGKVTTFVTSGGAGAPLDAGNIFHYVKINVVNGKVTQIKRTPVEWSSADIGKPPCNCQPGTMSRLARMEGNREMS
ncbi:MAG: metallophosphoesterase family protein [Clostridia bacterium]